MNDDSLPYDGRIVRLEDEMEKMKKEIAASAVEVSNDMEALGDDLVDRTSEAVDMEDRIQTLENDLADAMTEMRGISNTVQELSERLDVLNDAMPPASSRERNE